MAGHVFVADGIIFIGACGARAEGFRAGRVSSASSGPALSPYRTLCRAAFFGGASNARLWINLGQGKQQPCPFIYVDFPSPPG